MSPRENRIEVVEVGGRVDVGGAQVKAGDLIVGDADGVVVVPRVIEREVADMAQRISNNRGRTDCTVWGDMLTSVAHERGIAGTVVSGVCRDVSIGYPIFSVGWFMRTGKGRARRQHRAVRRQCNRPQCQVGVRSARSVR